MQNIDTKQQLCALVCAEIKDVIPQSHVMGGSPQEVPPSEPRTHPTIPAKEPSENPDPGEIPVEVPPPVPQRAPPPPFSPTAFIENFMGSSVHPLVLLSLVVAYYTTQ
jgi:hypothetical protein